MYLILFLTLLSSQVVAQSYSILESNISFSAPYTFGVHEGKSNKLSGNIVISQMSKLVLPIESLKTENSEINCHLYEALGLDYKTSDFPDEHVCEDDKLPVEGKNKLAFSNITYHISNSTVIDDSTTQTKLRLEGELEVHGVKKKEIWDITINNTGEKLTTKTKKKIVLADYGIIVKKFLFIKVKGTVEVEIDIIWERK